MTEKDIDLGMVTKAGMIDRAVADAAFALKEGEVSAPVQGPVRHRAGAGPQDRARAGAPLRGGAPASSSRSSRLRAPRPRCSSVYDKIEDARAGRRTARRGRRRSSSSPPVPSKRSTAPAATRPACPSQPPRPAAAAPDCLHHRRRRRAAIRCSSEGGYIWYRRRRNHARRASARSTRCKDAGRGALARARRSPPGSKAKATEILDKLKAGTTFAEVAAAERPQGRDHDRAQARRGARRRSRRRPSTRVFRTAKDAVGKAEGGAAGRAGRVPRDRHRGAEPRRCRPTKPSACSRHSIARSREDIFAEYIARLESEIGVTINQARAATGGQRRARRRRTEFPCRSSRRHAAFAKRYARGEAQVVWTTLVADLETPVSAFLKIAGGTADELPAGVGRRRRGARPLFDHRARSRSDLARASAASAEINARARTEPDGFAPCPRAAARRRCAR